MIDFSDFSCAEGVFRFFLEISKIPRGSGNTAAIADYLVNFANERGLAVIRDKYDNVVIKKPATPGYDNVPGVIFQGHTDIVAVKTPEADIDLTKGILRVYRDGDFLRAKDTSLGGDDGVAIAYALAILDSSDIPHPDFEAVFTSDEEVGLTGATGLEASAIQGRRMINIDSDEEGVFTVGCAGGVRVDVSLPVGRENVVSGKGYKIIIKGLLGGHSGIDIDKGRANAIKLLADILAKLGDIRIFTISGGVADNAIPTMAEAVIVACEDISERFEKAKADIITAWQGRECGIDISISECEFGTAFDKHTTYTLVSLILDEPSGVVSMSEDIPGLVQTSLNLGVIGCGGDTIGLGFSVRSSKNLEKEELVSLVESKAKAHGAVVSTRGAYPAWEYRKNSPLRDKMCKIYEKMHGRSPKVVTIHAGLECGIFSGKIPELDCVSLGPDNFDIHTTNEHLSISSTARVYEYLLEVLKDKEN